MPNSRDEVLSLLAGRPLGRRPVFGGLPSLTAAGLARVGVSYASAHTDASRMAAAAASTYEAFGYEAAVVPFDLCVEAEALGAGVDFQGDSGGFLAPVVARPLPVGQFLELHSAFEGLAELGRVPMVVQAIRELKGRVGESLAIGAWIPGPFTLGWQLFGADAWLAQLSEAENLGGWLGEAADGLARVGAAYREAGADYLTVHEMGGSPQVIGPRSFRRWVKPSLQRLIANLPAPAVLSVCGDTNAVVEDLLACGAAALNVDHRNDLARTRQIVGSRTQLFGNFDPVGVLSQGSPNLVTDTVRQIVAAGADAIWPGCDLWPEIPEANFRALMAAGG